MQFDIETLKKLQNFSKKFSKELNPNKIVLLKGELGSGKTTLVKYVLQSLNFPKNSVSSPSFTIINTYTRKSDNMKAHHIDLYRIEKKEELLEIGLRDYLLDDALVFIEWPEIAEEMIKQVPKEKILISFRIDNGKRYLDLTKL